MAKTEKPIPDDKKQSQAFIDKARELEADGDQSTADMLIAKLAGMKPEPRKLRKATD